MEHFFRRSGGGFFGKFDGADRLRFKLCVVQKQAVAALVL